MYVITFTIVVARRHKSTSQHLHIFHFIHINMNVIRLATLACLCVQALSVPTINESQLRKDRSKLISRIRKRITNKALHRPGGTIQTHLPQSSGLAASDVHEEYKIRYCTSRFRPSAMLVRRPPISTITAGTSSRRIP